VSISRQRRTFTRSSIQGKLEPVSTGTRVTTVRIDTDLRTFSIVHGTFINICEEIIGKLVA